MTWSGWRLLRGTKTLAESEIAFYHSLERLRYRQVLQIIFVGIGDSIFLANVQIDVWRAFRDRVLVVSECLVLCGEFTRSV